MRGLGHGSVTRSRLTHRSIRRAGAMPRLLHHHHHLQSPPSPPSHSPFSHRSFTTDTFVTEDPSHLSPPPPPVPPKVALILGVANQYSIAWAVTQAMLFRNHHHSHNHTHHNTATPQYRCIVTYEHEKARPKLERLVASLPWKHPTTAKASSASSWITLLPCNVRTDLPHLCQDSVPTVLDRWRHDDDQRTTTTTHPYTLDAVVHSVAYATELNRPLLHTSRKAYLDAQDVSAYSFLELARCVEPLLTTTTHDTPKHDGKTTKNGTGSSLTCLSYLGAVRAVPGYGSLGPAKAALESMVRGVAQEWAGTGRRCNAVSAGPVGTVSARGLGQFGRLRAAVAAETGGGVTAEDVADTVAWVAGGGAPGVTGQTIYVDGGYSQFVSVPST